MKCPDSVKRLLEIPFIEIRIDFEKLRNGWSSSNLLISTFSRTGNRIKVFDKFDFVPGKHAPLYPILCKNAFAVSTILEKTYFSKIS